MRVCAQDSGNAGHSQRQRRIPCAELIAEAPQSRLLLLRLMHHPHDPRVASIDRELFSANR
jgi:hypothetical protein